MHLSETWVVRRDGKRVKVYCFAMVLSHSRYKFVLWLDKPFTTSALIYPHNKAFEYFGGMTSKIVYDQDRILVAYENNRGVIYTKAFQNYIDTIKF